MPRLLLLFTSLALWAGCKNVSPAGTSFASDPPGARVHVNGQDSGWVTPCQLALDTEETQTVTIAMDGFASREILLVPAKRLGIINWYQGVNGVRSTIRFPILLPAWDFLLPLREARAHSPGRVFVRLHPAGPS